MNLLFHILGFLAYIMLVILTEVIVDKFVDENQCKKHEHCQNVLRYSAHFIFCILLIGVGFEMVTTLERLFPLV